MGLLDILSGGGSGGGGGLYGDLLNADQKDALQQRGLLGFLGGMQKSGALDYTVPFISGKVPGGLAAGLAGGAAGMGEAQDAGVMNALRAMLVGQQAQQLKANLAAMAQEGDVMKHLWGAGGGAGAAPSTAAPDLGGGLAAGGALTKPGGVTLAEAKAAALRAGFDEDGANTIAAISVPESSLNPNAYNPKDPAGGSFGLTQINGVHPGAREAMGNPDKAMELAFRVSKGGKDFSPWAGYTSGAYKPYLAEAAGIPVPALSGGSTGPASAAAQGPLAMPASVGGAPAPFTPPPGEISVPGKPGVVIDGKWYPSVRDWNLASDARGEAYWENAGPNGGAASSPVAPQGPLAMPAAAPSGGLLSPAAPSAAPMPSPAPALSAGGAMAAPGGINPQAAQALAFLRTMRGATVPDFINQAAGMPFVGPKAAAEQDAKNRSDATYQPGIKGAIKAAELPFTPVDLRPGGATGLYDSSGNFQPRYTAPTLQKTVGPDGNENYTYMTPQGAQPTGQMAALGPGQTETARLRPQVDPNTFGANPAPLTAGPGTTEPVKMGNGAVIPPVSQAAPIVGGADYLKDRQKQWSDTENEWSKGVRGVEMAEQRTLAIMKALKDYQSGAFASHLSEIRANLQAVGIHMPDSVAGDPAQAQIILKNNFGAAVEQMHATGLSKWTQAELFASQKNFASPDLQPEANLSIGAQTVGTLRWERAMNEAFGEAKKYGWRDPQNFQVAFAKANPVQVFVDQAKAEIGPLKGMAPGNAALPPGVPQGASQVGTYQGKPVFLMPDGSRKVLQ